MRYGAGRQSCLAGDYHFPDSSRCYQRLRAGLVRGERGLLDSDGAVPYVNGTLGVRVRIQASTVRRLVDVGRRPRLILRKAGQIDDPHWELDRPAVFTERSRISNLDAHNMGEKGKGMLPRLQVDAATPSSLRNFAVCSATRSRDSLPTAKAVATCRQRSPSRQEIQGRPNSRSLNRKIRAHYSNFLLIANRRPILYLYESTGTLVAQGGGARGAHDGPGTH
ncbi:hypothetical protein R1flu_017552 [Riccia fluitans]|uniref:Uncharacterized protein n=1 Tax=Riccia fluitans TaxID=41844 RepID=A0ABD1ZDB0_9MARC